MPFTLCHPALVIPLYRRAPNATSLPALVIGSMTPDFSYFFPIGVTGSFTHSWLGLLLYCVPVGALVYLIYRTLLRDAILAAAPLAIAARMHPTPAVMARSAKAVLVILGSLMAGAASHIVWDSFTHAHTGVVENFAALSAQVSLGRIDVPVFKVLQHVSSLLGLIVIVSYAVRWFSRTQPSSVPIRRLSRVKQWVALLVVGLAGACGSVAGLLLRPAISMEHALFNAVVTGMATASLTVVLLCLARKMRLARDGSTRPHG